MELARFSSLTLEELYLAHINGDFPVHMESWTLNELVQLSKPNEQGEDEEIFVDAQER